MAAECDIAWTVVGHGELALRDRIPLVWLIDSAGARIQEATGSMFARTGDLFREQVVMSGVVGGVVGLAQDRDVVSSRDRDGGRRRCRP